MKRIAFASTLLAAMSSLSAFAQDQGAGPAYDQTTDTEQAKPAVANRFYISPMASHTWEDSKRLTDAGWGGALGIGKMFSPFFMAELSAFYTEFHVGNETEIIPGGLLTPPTTVTSPHSATKLTGYGLSGLLFPFGGQVSQNFFGIVGVHAGKGKKHPSSGDESYDTVFADAGLGFLYGPFKWLNHGSIRAEARYRFDLHDEQGLGAGDESKFDDVVANVGLLIPIGALPVVEPPPAPPVEVVPVAAPVDSDGDGVPDDLDQCPGTPAGEPVNEVGCPLPKKECKTPEPGQPVTLEGCAAGDKIVLRGVNFEFDKSRLTTNAKTILDGVGGALNSAPSVSVEIGGHTDAKGTDEYNQKLSEKRAASVVQYLIGKGVDASRLTSAGYGESQPVADNETDEGRELNRRVELKVTSGVAEVAPSVPAAEPAPAEAAPAADAPPAEAPPAEAAPEEAAPAP